MKHIRVITGICIMLLTACGGGGDEATVVDPNVNIATNQLTGNWLAEAKADGYRQLITFNGDGTLVADHFVEIEGELHWAFVTFHYTYVVDGQTITTTQSDGEAEMVAFALDGDTLTITASSGKPKQYTKYTGQPPLAAGSEIHKHGHSAGRIFSLWEF